MVCDVPVPIPPCNVKQRSVLDAAGVERVASAEDDSSVTECRGEPLTPVSYRSVRLQGVCREGLGGLRKGRPKSRNACK